MNLFRSLWVVGWVYRSVLPLAGRPSIWIPFLVIAAAQVAALLLLLSFHRPGILPLAVPLVQSVAGDGATHYPLFFFALPIVLSRVSLFLAVFLGSLAIGAATVHFARAFGHQIKGNTGAWTVAARKYVPLFFISAVLAACLFGLSRLGGLVPQDQFAANGMVRWGTRGVLILLYILVQSLFVYATAWVVLRGHRAAAAVRDSFRVSGATFLPTFILVAIPILAVFPLSYVAGRADWFTANLNPETVIGVLVVRIVVELIFGFFLIGAITRLFLWRLEESR